MRLEDIVEPGDIVTVRDGSRYKVYIEPAGLYLEDMNKPKNFLDLSHYNHNLNHTGWSDKDIKELYNPRTKKRVSRPL